jgi:phosphotransferase system enzyme I (PtsI)
MTLACTGIGIGVTRAIALGPAYILHRGPIEVAPRWIQEHEVESEVERFRRALDTARAELKAVRAQIPPSTPPDIAEFIDTHLLMLEDVTISEGPLDLIRNQLCRAEWALQIRRDALVQVFDEMDDAYLRTRKDDVDHVVIQIQKILVQGSGAHTTEEDMNGRVIIAQDLTPADTILLRHRGVVAFVTEFGGPMSHTAILARSLGIPAVVGARNVTQYLRQDEMLVVDGEQGVVLAGADDATLDHYRVRIAEFQAHKQFLRGLLHQPSLSADGEPVHLLANIELAEDIPHAKAGGAAAVGLYRTEFLYMNRPNTPGEEEHLDAYLDVVRGLDGIPVTIRTLDLGADKQVESRNGLCPPVYNPALGLRAIRLCLKEPELFMPQLRAILRASAEGPVRVMLPMLTNLDEVLAARKMIEEAKQELKRDGLPFDRRIPVGGMIEVPAAALDASRFARHLDFLSIGTNDLVQYTLAIDRVDDEVNYLYDPVHPAVLRLIHMIIAAGRNQGIPVSMCGEMAGDPRHIPLLLGLGLRELSMQPNSLLEIKEIVRHCVVRRLAKLTKRLMKRLDSDDNIEPFLAEIGAAWRAEPR